MYTQFFNLAQLPFSIAPDPRYVFMSERHREALAHLLYGIGSGGGFVLLTGEIGTGKTTICRCLLEQIPHDCKVAYVFNPKLTVSDLLRTVCDEFRIALPQDAPAAPLPAAPSVKTYVDALNSYLLSAHAQGRNNVLIIDEAQNLSADVLEQLRLLTNLETNERKLLQIILIGQPELRAMLAKPQLEQLAQRVIARYHLGPLSPEETAGYIRHRLAVSGMVAAQPFGKEAMRLIHRLAKGIPRRINLLCDRSLLGAYAEGKQLVDRKIISKAAKEVFGESPAPAGTPAGRRALRYALPGMLAGAVLAGAAAWAIYGDPDINQLAAKLRGTNVATATAGAAVGALPVNPKSAPAAPVDAPKADAPAPEASTVKEPAAPDKPSQDHAAPSSAASGATAPSVAFATEIRLPSGAKDEGNAYRELARLWGVDLGADLAGGDPCKAALASGLRCYQSGGGLAEIRQLDRPAVLTLHDDGNENYPALLTGLTTANAVLDIDGKSQTVSLVTLGRHFHGSFVTFWRAPSSFREQVRAGDRGAEVDWIAAQLARQEGAPEPDADQAFDQPLARQVREFQAAHGLEKDGVVGPKTFMHLNNVAGINEPHLKTDPAMAGALPEK